MRKLGMLILDEAIEIAAGAGSTGLVDAATSDALGELLGRYDKLALQAIGEGAPTSGAAATIRILLDTSCDGIHWVTKSQSTDHSLAAGEETVFWFADDGSLPSHALVRVRARLSCEGAATARIRVFATARDSGAHDLQGVAPLDAYHGVSEAVSAPVPPPPQEAGGLCPV